MDANGWACFRFINVIQAEKITAMLKAVNVTVESYWPLLFAKLVKKRDIDDLILNVCFAGNAASAAASAGGAASAATAAEEPAAEDKEEIKEESDGEIFSLLDD
ncbi:hypothetical protein RJ639_017987 [Escallonia herrerae]|uniref:60S acidic ribosomal protein P1 n=1 Tax=Escallonia herrerae TaxID=1293975 RepID=A0AA88V8R1_9ASTE|nr:hypothetical protein RJ639_017987 [Escallonia herrerae]